MPDLLLISRDDRHSEQVARMAAAKGMRVKSTFSVGIGVEWLSVRAFDVLAVDAAVGVEDQQVLGDHLWKRNPIAPFILYDFDLLPAQRMQEARLFGAELAVGPNAAGVIERIFDQVNQLRENSGDFRIMVVEDLDAPRDIICSYIENLGFGPVVGMDSAKHALDELEQDPSRYSCIVTDIKMPEISGKDLIERVRAHKNLQHLPIVALTAHGTVDCLIDCLKAGASGFLVKPPRREDVARELSRAQRVKLKRTSPRLSTSEEADQLKEILIERGFLD